jgi:hypothetical protein
MFIQLYHVKGQINFWNQSNCAVHLIICLENIIERSEYYFLFDQQYTRFYHQKVWKLHLI